MSIDYQNDALLASSVADWHKGAGTCQCSKMKQKDNVRENNISYKLLVSPKRPGKLKTFSQLFLTLWRKTGFVFANVQRSPSVYITLHRNESLHLAGLLYRAMDDKKGGGTSQVWKVTGNVLNQNL